MPRMEKLEGNKVKLYFEVTAERFEEGLKHSYQKNKGNIVVPGFRKGRVPRKVAEMTYGLEIFLEDALDFILPEAFQSAAKELEIEKDMVSQPIFDADEISKETGVHFIAEFYIKPEVTVDNYYGIQYKPKSIEVTDKDVDLEIEKVREKNSRVLTVERPVEDGDIAVIDFKGFMDDVAFDGGEGEDYQLVIGSHTFIDNFEEQLIGMSAGDMADINVTFPEDYHVKGLSGKEAVFKVTVKEVKMKEMPEVDDEFAQDVSEFDTLEEYKQDIASKLKKSKEEYSDQLKEEQLKALLAERIGEDIPEDMYSSELVRMMNDLKLRLSYQGMDLPSYLQYTKQNFKTFHASSRLEAVKRVKSRLALEYIAKQEAIEIGDEELNAEIEEIAKSYGVKFDELKASMGEPELEDLEETLKQKKAMKLVMDNAVAIDEEESV